MKYFSDFSISYQGWRLSMVGVSDLKATEGLSKAVFVQLEAHSRCQLV
jgi:hypothetical protein